MVFLNTDDIWKTNFKVQSVNKTNTENVGKQQANIFLRLALYWKYSYM